MQEVFLGELLDSTEEAWYIETMVGTRQISFKVDTGADVSLILTNEF